MNPVKISFTVIGILLSVTISSAQDWEWSLAAKPDIDIEITGISMLSDGLTGWAVGNNAIIGRIYRTTDGWETWIEQTKENLLSFKFRDVCFTEELNGWIVGNGGIVLHTIDGGENWEIQGNGVTYCDLNKVSAVDDKTVFACGSRGTIIYTNDGSNWSKTAGIGTTNEFSGIDMFDAMHGIVVGQATTIYYTTDGVHWKPASQVPLINGKDLNSISMINHYTAWAVGDVCSSLNIKSVFVKTTDGGNSWTIWLPADSIMEKIMAVDFTSPTKGVAVGWRGCVFVTKDGNNWINLPRQFSNNSKAVAIVGDKIWATGLGGIINYSDDLGRTWSFLTKVNGNYLYKICVPNSQRIMAIGYASSTLTSEDGGVHWTSGSIIAENHISQQLWGIDFATTNIGWVAGSDGFIARTIDGGNSWSLQATNLADNWLTGLWSFDENSVWVIGKEGAIFKSNNGGDFWDFQGNSFITADLCDIEGVDRNHLIIVGDQSTLLYTDDGGRTWLQSSFNLSGRLKINAMHIVDASHAWAVGDSGTILFSADVGRNWSKQNSLGTIVLNDVHFRDNSTGWIVGDNGMIFETMDNGNHWTSIANGVTDNSLKSIDVTDDGKIFICGYGGVVVSFRPTQSVSERKEPGQIPDAFYLSQNYPNPFNDRTILKYRLPLAGHIDIAVYNINGRQAATLIDEWKAAGSYHLTWDAKDMSSGIYFIRMIAPNFSAVRKILLVK